MRSHLFPTPPVPGINILVNVIKIYCRSMNKLSKQSSHKKSGSDLWGQVCIIIIFFIAVVHGQRRHVGVQVSVLS